MLQESLRSGELSPQEKILLARGASLDSSEPRLNILVSLAADPDGEVRRAAQETIRRLPDEECARLLAAPSLEGFVASYFLDPAYLRPALLPILLKHPATPVEAMKALAAQAGPELIPVLLAHLEHLKTPVLMALKENPAYLNWQKRPTPSSPPVAEKGPPVLGQGTKQVLEGQPLGLLVSRVADPNEEVRRAAQQTLENLSDEECLDLLAEPSLEEPVARYFLEPAHLRPALLPVLLSHPDAPQEVITNLAASAGPDVVAVLLDQMDSLKTTALLALKENPTYLLWQKEPPAQGYVLEVDLLDLLIQEMETEPPPFKEQELEEMVEEAGGDDKKGGLVKKIAEMKVAQRVKLALLGTREERSLLIRDSSKVVCRAVLGSPKLSDSEVESFAAMKNVNQDVLRLISMNRKFMKSYTVLKNLVNNPRTPIDVSMPLLNRLLPNDLRAVAGSKDVPDTTRKTALKLQKARSQSGPG